MIFLNIRAIINLISPTLALELGLEKAKYKESLIEQGNRKYIYYYKAYQVLLKLIDLENKLRIV